MPFLQFSPTHSTGNLPSPTFLRFSYTTLFGARSILRSNIHPFGLYTRSYKPALAPIAAHPRTGPAHPQTWLHPARHPPPGPTRPAPPSHSTRTSTPTRPAIRPGTPPGSARDKKPPARPPPHDRRHRAGRQPPVDTGGAARSLLARQTTKALGGLRTRECGCLFFSPTTRQFLQPSTDPALQRHRRPGITAASERMGAACNGAGAGGGVKLRGGGVETVYGGVGAD